MMLQSEATTPEPNAYTLLGDLLDLILTFSEHRPSWVVPTERGRAEYAESTLPLSCVEQLLELLTIAGCEHIFTYIESRVDRLTMVRRPVLIFKMTPQLTPVSHRACTPRRARDPSSSDSSTSSSDDSPSPRRSMSSSQVASSCSSRASSH